MLTCAEAVAAGFFRKNLLRAASEIDMDDSEGFFTQNNREGRKRICLLQRDPLGLVKVMKIIDKEQHEFEGDTGSPD